MKQTKNVSRKINMLLFILVSICAIIFIMIRTIADDNLNMRQVRYQLGSAVSYEFSFFTDSPKFHTKASGYEKYKGLDTENNMNSIVATDMVKMQGYGNYEFKPDTNLFSFIDYCYSKAPEVVEMCAYRAGTTAENEWNYTKLMNYRDRAINTDFFKHFWQNMSSLCTNFKDYQDDFFFLHYTYPATQKVGINLAMMRNLQNEGESVKEYLTCLTSYIFSITPQAQIEGMTFGKGDVVPFLYYKDKKHANIDVRNDSEALMDIAKYAYVALIEGWCTLPTPYHLWENEYNWLFGNYEPVNLDYDLETLHQWYDETYQRYCKDKGKKGNNLLGSTIEHIIESDYSIEQQLEAVEQYIRDVFTDLGIETDFKETMARNELMAKYMMQNSNFDATIKDYKVTIEFMTENLQRGTHEEQNTHTVVTSDFQKLEFPYTMNERHSHHSDEDGISDGVELGNEKWINITEFVKRTYEDAVRKGDPHKATFEEQVEDIIEKNGAYTDFNGNKVYGSVKWDDMKLKVLYRVYDYKSNPKLNDTDFDGLWDNADSKPIDNKLSGTSTEIGKVEYNQDFRWFYTDNKKYNDELCTMSLIASNLARGNTITTDQVSGNIQEYLEKLGFTDIRNISNNGEVYVGKKKITYYGITKNIYALIIGERNLENNYRAMLMKAQENNGTTNAVYIDFGKTLEEKATEIGRLAFLDNNFGTDTYWVTGYGLGGSIASELASKLTDAGGEVFCYTFGAINTGKERKGTYDNIKNVINEDDYIPKMMNKNIYSKPGQIYSNSIKENLMFEYRDITGNTDYRGDYCLSNFLTHIFEAKKNGMTIDKYRQLVEEMARNLTYFTSLSREVQIDGEISDLAIAYDNMTKANKDAHSIKSYYVLAKSLNGFDLLDRDEKKQEHYERIDETMLMVFAGTEIIKTEEELLFDPRDGVLFVKYKDELREKDDQNLNPYNNNLEPAVKIEGFKFSNYTISSNYKDRDINYVKFWNDVSNGKLSEYRIGDYNGKTKFTCEIESEHFNSFINSFPNPTIEGSAGRIKNINGMYIIDDRILAAFPAALAGEGDYQYESFLNDMHRVSSYKRPIEWENNKYAYTNKISQKDYGSYEGTGNGKYIGGNDIYKLVDCVFEDSGGRQFVVPFIVIDAKLLHLLPNMYDANKDQFLPDETSKMGMMSHLTDNRYGQVVEEVVDSELNNYIGENDINGKTYTYYEVIDKVIAKENEGKPDDDKKSEAVIISKNEYENFNLNKYQKYRDGEHKIVYFDKSIPREVVSLSPIEVLTDGRILEDYQINEVIFGNRDKYKLISMRIYKDESNSTDIIYSPDRTEYGTTGLITLKSKVALPSGIPDVSVWHRYKKIIDEINTQEKKNSLEPRYSGSILSYFYDKGFDRIVNY